jgi:hypothetical protein
MLLSHEGAYNVTVHRTNIIYVENKNYFDHVDSENIDIGNIIL